MIVEPLLPSDFLLKLLAYLDAATPSVRAARVKLLASDLHDRPRFRADVNVFMMDVLKAMGDLPETGERETHSLRDVERSFLEVKRSFDVAKQLLRVAVAASQIRGEKFDLAYFMAFYFDTRDEFRNFKALASWIWRRTRAGRQKTKAYLDRPDVKRRIAKNRPSKEEEAERQRLRYWRKKGFVTPPPRLPKVPGQQGLLIDEDEAASPVLQ